MVFPTLLKVKISGRIWHVIKYSLSTCSGCHTGDTGTEFSNGEGHQPASSDEESILCTLYGRKSKWGHAHVVRDRENTEEKHEFFDLKAREEIARDILSVAREVDEAAYAFNSVRRLSWMDWRLRPMHL